MSRLGPSGGEVTAASSPGVLEPWIATRLHPLDSRPAFDPALAQYPELIDLPAPGEAYVPAAVLMALVERADGLNVILTRRADTLKRHSGQIALPGGRAEAGETPWETAIREAEEEIALERRFVRPVGLGDVLRTHTGFEITPVIAFAEPGFSLVPAADEVAEVFETPFKFLMDPANHEERVWEGPEGRRSYYAMTHGERMIWGVTAAILRSLWMRLFRAEALIRQNPPLAAAGR